MQVEKSVGLIIIRKENDFKFLILYKKASGAYKEQWEFPKGNVEANENEKSTAIREIREETGLPEKEIKFLDFHEKISYFYRNEQGLVKKEVTYLMAQTTKIDIKISVEHNSYQWAGYLEAFELLTQRTSKDLLKKAFDFLRKSQRQKILF
jgi:tRNA nucleotidyltransferase (CCA-adding enzyme)